MNEQSELTNSAVAGPGDTQYHCALALLSAGLDAKITSDLTALSIETVRALFDAARGEYGGALITGLAENLILTKRTAHLALT